MENNNFAAMIEPFKSFADAIYISFKDRRVSVPRTVKSTPAFNSWIERNSSVGIQFEVVVEEMQVISALREQSGENTVVGKDAAGDGTNASEAIAMIEEAAYYRASDIHILVRGSHADVQVTVNGDLRQFREYRKEKCTELIAAIWRGLVSTGDSQLIPNQTQNAQITGEKLKSDTFVTSVRIVRGPMYPTSNGGQFMVLRLQYVNSDSRERRQDLPPLRLPRAPEGEFLLPKLGFTELNISRLKKLMAMPDGILIITGPTGSGKSTTDYELRKEEARVRPYLKQIQVADPIEFPESWSTQIPVTNALDHQATAKKFGEAFAAALRMAPRIIAPGEIRTPEVAMIAFEAATTGHKVPTTLHVSDAFLWPDRLELMDPSRINRRMFCDHKIVRGVVAQRLMRILCLGCSKLVSDYPDSVESDIMDNLKTWAHDGDVSKVRVLGDGCEKCHYEGVTGRFGIMEVVISDSKLMHDFVKHGSSVARRNYHERADVDPPLLETAIKHVLSGEVDPYLVGETVDGIVSKEQFHEVYDGLNM